MKKVVCILMVLLLLICGCIAEGIPKKELYAYGMEALYDFDADSLIAAQAYFEAAGTYKDASLYLLYAQALYYIALSEESLDYLDEAQTNLELLAADEMFLLSLQENSHTSCEDLLKYIEARKLENIGKTEEALEIYVSINRVLDSMQRQRVLVVGDKEQRYETALRLFNEGKYNEALLKFQDLGNYKESLEMYEKALEFHSHDFSVPTCEADGVCKICGALGKPALGHDWRAATCSQARTCAKCGKIEGTALGHSYTAATCIKLATCVRCGQTTGDYATHDYAPATYTQPATCRVCGRTTGTVLTPTASPKPKQRDINRARLLGSYIINGNSAYANDYYTYSNVNTAITYYPGNAFDGDSETSWLCFKTTKDQNGIYLGNQWNLTSSYRSSYNAYGFVIRIGLQHRRNDTRDPLRAYNGNSRPKDITVSINGHSFSYSLRDTMEEQTFYFPAEIKPNNGLFDFRIQIDSIWTGELGKASVFSNGLSQYAIAIAEVDLVLINND